MRNYLGSISCKEPSLTCLCDEREITSFVNFCFFELQSAISGGFWIELGIFLFDMKLLDLCYTPNSKSQKLVLFIGVSLAVWLDKSLLYQRIKQFLVHKFNQICGIFHSNTTKEKDLR